MKIYLLTRTDKVDYDEFDSFVMVVPENYKKVLKKFSEKNDNKPVMLFAVLKMDEHVDKWSILISVSWINAEIRQTVFQSFIEALQESLNKEELDEVARAVFYDPDEHLVDLFFDKFREGQYIKEDAKINGNIIYEGYVIALKKD